MLAMGPEFDSYPTPEEQRRIDHDKKVDELLALQKGLSRMTVKKIQWQSVSTYMRSLCRIFYIGIGGLLI